MKVFPNPFVCFTRISTPNTEDTIQIYDISGKLIENPRAKVVGKNLVGGIYFVKIKGYEPTKIIKIGRAK